MTWSLLAILLVCSAGVSGSETALFGLRRRMLYRFSRSDRAFARRVHTIMQQPRRVLLTVLIANTTINVAIFAISFIAIDRLRHEHAGWAAFAGVAVLLSVIVFGEVVPKAVALNGAVRFAPPAAALMTVLQTVVDPIRWVLATLFVEPITRLLAPSTQVPDHVTTEELRLLVERSEEEGHLDSTESEMLQAVVTLADVSIREVMTPRVDIQAVPIREPRGDVLDRFDRTKRRRLPVFDRDLDDIQGFLYLRDLLLRPDVPIRLLVRPIPFVPAQVNLMQLLRFLRDGPTDLAVVVDEHGGTAGLVAVEDVVRWIVGDVDRFQYPRQDQATQRIDENTYRIPGELSVRVWADRFAVGEIDRRIDTVGGLVLSKIGRMPRVGDRVRVGNLTLTVESMNKRRIVRVLLRRDLDGATPGEDAP